MARTLAPTRQSGAAFIASGPSMRLPSDADSVTGNGSCCQGLAAAQSRRVDDGTHLVRRVLSGW